VKTTVVPAQITTVEDTITGNLTLTQLILLASSIVTSLLIYAFLSPLMRLSGLKVIIMTLTACTVAMMALRFRGRLVLTWVTLLVRYNFRPRYYVFDKNDQFARGEIKTSKLSQPSPNTPLSKGETNIGVHPKEVIRISDLMGSPLSKLTFKSNRRGQLRVIITQIK
jgi:hypothetical protein